MSTPDPAEASAKARGPGAAASGAFAARVGLMATHSRVLAGLRQQGLGWHAPVHAHLMRPLSAPPTTTAGRYIAKHRGPGENGGNGNPGMAPLKEEQEALTGLSLLAGAAQVVKSGIMVKKESKAIRPGTLPNSGSCYPRRPPPVMLSVKVPGSSLSDHLPKLASPRPVRSKPAQLPSWAGTAPRGARQLEVSPKASSQATDAGAHANGKGTGNGGAHNVVSPRPSKFVRLGSAGSPRRGMAPHYRMSGSGSAAMVPAAAAASKAAAAAADQKPDDRTTTPSPPPATSGSVNGENGSEFATPPAPKHGVPDASVASLTPPKPVTLMAGSRKVPRLPLPRTVLTGSV